MNDHRLEPGTVLADKYRLETVIGTGGMGTVYQAEHLALKAPVAVKVIDREVDVGDVALARFMREAQSAASLRSPHVVQILDYGMEGKRPFMVMEMLEGEPLANRLKRLGRLTPQETFRVLSHVSRAVSKAHEADIIHRDLKPDNVFLVHNEGDEIAKVLDFGVAKVEATQLDGEGHTRTGSLLGTPYYMSPEQAQGNKDIDARSDLWALGVIAFECMTGRRPFSSDGLGDLVLQICIRDIPIPSKIVPVPPGFDAWFEKACNRDPDARFQTARDLAESLRSALDLGSEAGVAVPESKWIRASGPVPLATLESETATLGSDTTQPDPSQRSLQDTSPTVADLPVEKDDERKPNSQWEIVPHGREESNPDLETTRALEAATALESPAGLPGRSKKGSGGSLAFVAIIALMLGGAIVFGIRQARLDESADETQTVRPRPMGTALPAASPTNSPTPDSSSGQEATPEAPTDSSDEPAVDEGVPPDESEVPDDEAASEDATDPNPESADDPLDAIDQAAQEALEERKKAAAEKNKAAQEKGAPPKDTAEDSPENGPQPKLPDGLAPAPAPPPPPQ